MILRTETTTATVPFYILKGVPVPPKLYEDNDEEPAILRYEVQQAIKPSPKNKSPGIDDITTKTTLTSWEIGITWLTSIFKNEWNERKVPDDCQRAVIVPI